LEPPLNQGFAEFIYWVEETVEYQGYRMPSRAVAKRIAASGPTLYDQVVCEFTLSLFRLLQWLCGGGYSIRLTHLNHNPHIRPI